MGKSTLFNALTKSKSAQAANFPFCTIDPNIGEVTVPDQRLLELSKISVSAETIPTKMTFIDIAGLVKGLQKARVWAISSWQILENVMRWPMSQDALRMKT